MKTQAGKDKDASLETPLMQNLKRLMHRQGWRAAPLSLAAGLHASYVRDILRGRARHPSAERLERLARVLGVPLQDLTGGGREDAAMALPPTPMLRQNEPQTLSEAMFGSRIDGDGNLLLSVPRESPLRGQATQLLSLFAALPASRRKALLFWLLREQDLSGSEDHLSLWPSPLEGEFISANLGETESRRA